MPAGQNFHISQALSNISMEYSNSEFIATKFIAMVPVAKESDLMYVHNRDFRIPESHRANGAEANQITWSISTTSYTIYENALKDIITDRDKDNADQPLMLQRETTEFLTEKLLLNQEKLAVDLCFTTTTWANSTTYVTATSWALNTTTTSPILDTQSATSTIIRSSGKRPNFLILGHPTYDGVRNHVNIIERLKYSERAVVTEEILAAVLDVDKVLVGRSVYDAGAEGVSESITSLWTDSALLGYFEQSPGRKKPSAAYRFSKTNGGNPYRVKKWRAEELSGDMIEASTFQQPLPVSTQCAYFFKSAGIV